MDTAKGRERTTKPAGRQLPNRSLPQILDRIRSDARDEAARYLRESEVPSGGE
jgi:hypothetical protein